MQPALAKSLLELQIHNAQIYGSVMDSHFFHKMAIEPYGIRLYIMAFGMCSAHIFAWDELRDKGYHFISNRMHDMCEELLRNANPSSTVVSGLAGAGGLNPVPEPSLSDQVADMYSCPRCGRPDAPSTKTAPGGSIYGAETASGRYPGHGGSFGD